MTPRPAAATAAAVALLASTSCGGETADPEAEAVPAWEVVEEVRIGSVDDPESALTYLSDLEVADDGSIYAMHPQEQIVRRFAADGTRLNTIGGKGDGPGELQNAYNLGLVGDTLWVLDFDGYEFSFFGPDGTFVRSFTVPFGSTEDFNEAQPPRARGLLADGTIHGASPAFSHLIAEGVLTHDRAYLLDADGEVTDTLPPVPFGDSQWAISDPDDPRRGGMYRQQPFAEGPLWGIVPSARAIVVVDRDVRPDEAAPSVRITRLTFTGDTVFSTTVGYEPRPIGSAEIDSIMATAVPEDGFLGATKATVTGWARQTLHVPAHRPGVTAMMLTGEGETWLARQPDEDGTKRWTILDAGGVPIGDLSLRSTFRAMAAEDGVVWGVETDELDVPYIVGLRFRRHAGAAESAGAG